MGSRIADGGRYAADSAIDARRAAASRTNAMPESYGTLSHLCPSVAHESARPSPRVRCARSGDAAAHKPNAPSTCTHAPARLAQSQIGSNGSYAPEFTLPACAQTIAEPE